MKEEINNVNDLDAQTIYNHYHLVGNNVKGTVRDFLRGRKIGVLDCLVEVEKQNSSRPQSKSF